MVWSHDDTKNATVTETDWWRVTWESDSRRQRHPQALDDEELFIVDGSTERNVPTAENSANKGLVEIMPKTLSKNAHPKHLHTSQRAHSDLPTIVGNTARGASEPAKPGKRMPLP